MKKSELNKNLKAAQKDCLMHLVKRPLAVFYRGGFRGYKQKRAMLKRARDEIKVHIDYVDFERRRSFHYDGYFRSFKHSGNAGDIIYALPAIREMCSQSRADLYLELDVPMDVVFDNPHPSGAARLNETMFSMLRPLLVRQIYIKSCSMYENQSIDCNLDNFRDSPLFLDRGSISRWCAHVFGLALDLTLPWLTPPSNLEDVPSIIVARSFRYRNPALDYGILSKFKSIGFIGVDSEFNDFRKLVPHVEHVRVSNCDEMASKISACDLFIGNQSMPFAIAEGLKVRRILEVAPAVPNVIPEGGEFYEAYFQGAFHAAIMRMIDNAGMA